MGSSSRHTKQFFSRRYIQYNVFCIVSNIDHTYYILYYYCSVPSLRVYLYYTRHFPPFYFARKAERRCCSEAAQRAYCLYSVHTTSKMRSGRHIIFSQLHWGITPRDLFAQGIHSSVLTSVDFNWYSSSAMSHRFQSPQS